MRARLDRRERRSVPIFKPAANARAWAIGEMRRGRFHVRRIVWGRTMARYDKLDGEIIRQAQLMVRVEPSR